MAAIDGQEEYLANVKELHTRRLRLLTKQAARQGASTPPEITMEIEDIQTKLNELDRRLAGNPILPRTRADTPIKRLNLLSIILFVCLLVTGTALFTTNSERNREVTNAYATQTSLVTDLAIKSTEISLSRATQTAQDIRFTELQATLTAPSPTPNNNITPIESIVSSVFAHSSQEKGASGIMSIQGQASGRPSYRIQYTLPGKDKGCSDNDCFSRIAFSFNETQDLTPYKYFEFSIIFEGEIKACNLYFIDVRGPQAGVKVGSGNSFGGDVSIETVGNKQTFRIPFDPYFKSVNRKIVSSIFFNVDSTFSEGSNIFTVSDIDFIK